MNLSPKDKEAYADYLSGIVKDDAYEAACYYEYARQSNVLTATAAQRKKRLVAQLNESTEIAITENIPGSEWIIDSPWVMMWQCPSFPAVPWNSLRDRERQDIRLDFPSSGIPPLRTRNIALAASVLQRLTIKAEKIRKLLIESIKTGERAVRSEPLLVENWNLVHVLFTLDFTKTKKRLRQEFEAWLDLKDNRDRLATHAKSRTGTTGDQRSRLKELAVWRLYDGLGGFDALNNFASHNRRKERGKIVPFYDKRGTQDDLYSDPIAAKRAIKSAKNHLKTLMPNEFANPFGSVGKKLGDKFRSEISKNSS